MTSPPGVRSLAEDLRRRSDQDLHHLLVARPDLARPAPEDLTALAARSMTRASTTRAIDDLDRASLDILTVCAALGGDLDLTAVIAALGLQGESERGEEETLVFARLEELWRLGLLWGEHPRHLSRSVGEVLGPHVAGLGPSCAELDLTDRRSDRGSDRRSDAALVETDEGMPGAAVAVLDALTWGPPVRAIEPGTRALEGAQWLADHGLCQMVDGIVTLPRETALQRRGSCILRVSQLRPPTPVGRAQDPASVERAAGGSASECLSLIDEVLANWSTKPPRVLKAGGLAARDLTATARGLELTTGQAAFVLELAFAAGLLAESEEEEAHWVPTADYDGWLDEPGGARWARLVGAWWTSTRDAAAVGTHRDGKLVAALSVGVHRPWVRGLRQDILAIARSAGPARALDVDAIAEVLAWQRPRRLPTDVNETVRSVLAEATTLGLLGVGAATPAVGILVSGPRKDAQAHQHELARAIETHLPPPVEHVLLQADLTAIVPGPMAGGLGHFLRLAADLESRGGASVHRFSERSLRRALDGGWSVEDILQALADASPTQVPQPLEYLVRDTARRHGRVRVTGARGVLVVDEPAALEPILADRALGALRLRRIAPTVALSRVAPELMVDLLREAGHPAVIETVSGTIALREPRARRARSSTAHRPTLQSVDEETAAAIIAEMRRSEATAGPARALVRPALVPTGEPTTSMVVLREASADRRPIWVGYSDGTGAVRRFLFHPENVENGRVHGTADGVRRTLSIHRITGVAAD